MKVLIVEDHSEMRRMIRSIISNSVPSPLEIFECSNGEDAVSMYSDVHPDCVFMDFELGGMNGFQAVEVIRAKDKSAYVIMVSSYDNPRFRSKAEHLGLNGFVSKDHLSDIAPLLQTITNK